MAQNISTILFFCLLLQAVAGSMQNARLRGKNFDALEEFVRSPQIDAAIRGKTLKDLGIEERLSSRANQKRRRAQEDDGIVSFEYFTVYDEFITANFTTLGETSGSRGVIYDTSAKDEGLLEDNVEGALQGSCSLVSSDGKQLCSFEFFLMNPSTGSLGTVVATGTVKKEVDTNSVLLIEATGDDFIKYNTGMVIIRYTAIGEQTVMDLEIAMR